MKKILSFLVLMCVSLSAMASETSVLNSEGVEIWYDFDSSTKTASVTCKGSSWYSYSSEYTGEVVIPSTVTYEGEKYSVTSIGNYAFYECYSLTSITLPESVTSIGNSAFDYCHKLYEVYNKSDLTITAGSWNNGYVAYYAKNVYTDSEGESKLKTVGDYLFYVDGEDIELIAYTGSETSITLPSDYEGKNYNIVNSAFFKCDALTSITLPEGVTSIGKDAFAYCSALTSITIPDSLTSIGDYAFYDCYALTSITSKNTTPPTIGGSYTFKYVNKSIPVYVPKSSVDTYKSAEYWKDFTNIVGVYFVDVIAENGTVEGAGAYEENAKVTLTVTPAEGYKFVKWSDGVTDNPRTVVVTSDTTFTADIQKSWTIYATAENGDISGVGVYLEGDEATLTATPAEGYKFVQWSDGVTDNPRTVVVVSDATFTAEFGIDDTPISDIQTSDVNVRLIGNNIVVEGADEYTVFSISGQNLGKAESVERGIYIVVVNGKSYKVVAK